MFDYTHYGYTRDAHHDVTCRHSTSRDNRRSGSTTRSVIVYAIWPGHHSRSVLILERKILSLPASTGRFQIRVSDCLPLPGTANLKPVPAAWGPAARRGPGCHWQSLSVFTLVALDSQDVTVTALTYSRSCSLWRRPGWSPLTRTQFLQWACEPLAVRRTPSLFLFLRNSSSSGPPSLNSSPFPAPPGEGQGPRAGVATPIILALS